MGEGTSNEREAGAPKVPAGSLGTPRADYAPTHDAFIDLIAHASLFCHALNNILMIIDGNVRRLAQETDEGKRRALQERLGLVLKRLQREADALTRCYRPLKQAHRADVEAETARIIAADRNASATPTGLAPTEKH